MMTTRPTPNTPYQRKLYLAQEQAFYERYGTVASPSLSAVGALAHRLADALDALSHGLRAVGGSDRHHHAA